ncbi:MAG: tetratricopeptide repeat protein, partial [Pseudomonadota bacterium]
MANDRIRNLIIGASAALLLSASPTNADAKDCDLLAAARHDNNSVSEPVSYTSLRSHADQAVNACQVALRDDPSNPRIQFQLGRSLLAAAKDKEAAEVLKEAADAQYPAALNAYAILLDYGRGITPDQDAVLPLIKLAAERGHVPAMANLGALYNNISGGRAASTVDRPVSLEWLHKAAENNDPLALARLGWNYGMGDGGASKDKELSYGFLKRALALDEESAHYIVVEVMASGFNEWQEAQKYIKQLKHSKNRLFMLHAGGFSYSKKLIEKFSNIGFRFDRPEEEPLYIRGFVFDQDLYHAQIMESLLDGMNGPTKSAAKAFIDAAYAKKHHSNKTVEATEEPDKELKATDFGSKSECDSVASSPRDNLALAKPVEFETLAGNAARAVSVCKSVVDANAKNTRARYLLGRSYLAAGEDKAAVRWIQDAANRQYPAAMNTYGVLLNHGRGVAIDYARSFEWLKKAADAGDAPAAINLATSYFMGVGVDLNSALGTQWVQVGVKRNDPKALFTLGGGYAVSPIWYRTIEVKRDEEKGAALILKAHQMGDLDATYALHQI